MNVDHCAQHEYDTNEKLRQLLSEAAALRTVRRRPRRDSAARDETEDLEAMEETALLLSDPEELQAVREGIADLDSGRTHDLEEVIRKMRAEPE